MRKVRNWLLSLVVLFCFQGPLWAAPFQPLPPAADTEDPSGAYHFTPTSQDEALATRRALDEAEKTLPGGHIKMSGRYRIAAGANSDDFILNDANANQNLNYLQGPNFRYVFGERLNNTYDPGIYSQFLLNLDFSPRDKFNFYTQIVNDPWSWVGTTGEQVQRTDVDDSSIIRYNLKYFGSMNSTLGEVYRASDADRFNFPQIKVHDSHLGPARVVGLLPGILVPADHTTINIPALDVDMEYRPIRKLWMDYEEDQWKARIFALADETQALTTDDPLELSNHKDYWQQSPWLYQYKPIQFFTDVDSVNSVKRGFYSDDLSYTARDSEGNRLVLLRGVAYKGEFDKTNLSAVIAAPYTPWDEDYFDADNVPGALRVKQQLTDRLLLGGTYTFRNGLVDNEVADFNQVFGIDAAYALNEAMTLKSEAAFSQRQHELTSPQRFRKTTDGFAYKGVLETKFKHDAADETEWQLSYTQMDRAFEPPLSRYLETRDDSFWGTHLSFHEKPNLEPFRLGDGVDRDRIVVRAQWREKRFKERFQNLLDFRNVHKEHNTAYVETVVRDEVIYKVSPRLTAKGLIRWRGLPTTTAGFEPVMTDLYFPKDEIDLSDFRILNAAIPADKNADQFIYSFGLQYLLNSQWTAEGIAERTNAIPDFPRGLLNEITKSPNDRVDGLLVDRMTRFLYGQDALKAVPPYDYFNIFKERLVYKPCECYAFTLHAAQNGYRYAGGIDDSINHGGISMEFHDGKKWDFFADYTLSRQVDLPRLIATNFREEQNDYHHNLYFSADYLINLATRFRLEYGVFDLGVSEAGDNPYSSTTFSLPTIDTEHLVRASLTGDF
mgnify:CR=1 FL=1